MRCIEGYLNKTLNSWHKYHASRWVSLRGTERSDCIYFLLQKKGINKHIQILSLHDITYCMMSNANAMIGYTTLWKVVSTNAFRSIPTTNLCKVKSYKSILKVGAKSKCIKSNFSYISHTCSNRSFDRLDWSLDLSISYSFAHSTLSALALFYTGTKIGNKKEKKMKIIERFMIMTE